jgi:undecaprenyl-diphosphatase
MLFIAIVLGIVQGLGEFLPISSSAHLIIVRWLFGWDETIAQAGGEHLELVLDVALHVGTLLAVVTYFFKDWLRLTLDGLTKGIKTQDGKMFWYLVAATIPGGLAGLSFESFVETVARTNLLLIAFGLAFMGIVLYYVDKQAKQVVKFEQITFKQALIVGFSQALALVPGVSRSGVTMTAGRFLGFSRETAAKFSFLMSTPIIAGAALRHTLDILPNLGSPLFWVGTLTSALVGLFCISFLLKYLQKNNFAIFAIYRILLAGLVLVVYFIRG